MAKRSFIRARALGDWNSDLIRCVMLALFFLLGAFLGRLYAGGMEQSTWEELERYLVDYCTVFDSGAVTVSFFRCFLLCAFFPLAVFFLGFSAFGVVLTPVLSALFGFLPSYGVCCFLRTFGREGIYPALAVFCLRLLVSLPCFLLLACQTWPASVQLAAASLGRGRHVSPARLDGRFFPRLCVCVCILFLGALLEKFLSPVLFRLALADLF